MHHFLLSFTTCLACAHPRGEPQSPDPTGIALAQPAVSADVRWSRSHDGSHWVRGATYKAGFAGDGFTYTPFLGGDAPRSYPVRFVLSRVLVGGQALAFLRHGADVRRQGDATVVIDRGLVDEVYHVTESSVEQTFVVDTDVPGDVVVELEVESELREDADRDGLQFGNELGSVEYGRAFLVAGGEKRGIETRWEQDRLALHVPAAARGEGRVVIDPVVTTRLLTPGGTDSLAPDLAYDATTDRWLVVWAWPFSANDHDVVAEKRTGSGEAIAGSFTALDVSPVSYSMPRVANLNRFDRFLVVMDRIDNRPGGTRHQVWARTVEAAGVPAPGPEFAISDSFPNSNQWQADVGGDPGTGRSWFVAWVKDGDTYARLVDADGATGAAIPIETSLFVSEVPQVSSSNGNGQVSQPRWCVVYTFQAGAGNRDIYAVTFDAFGGGTGGAAIAAGPEDDRWPQVSSPLVDGRSTPAFAISYERQGPVPELHLQVATASLGGLVPEVNLSRRYGIGGVHSRVDSDGLRIAAAARSGTTLALSTLAVVDGGIVMHEAPQPAWTGDSPNLASKRSGGGGTTDYGFVYRRTDSAPSVVEFGLYLGHAAGGFTRRPTGCGLALATGGLPILGQTPRFTLTNVAGDVPFVFVGLQAPATTWCGSCQLGIPTGSILTTVLASTLDIRIPAELRLIGTRLAVQGLGFGSGPCSPSALRFSDTVDLVVQ